MFSKSLGVCSFTHQFQSVVDEIIERMDEYYLSKEDWDTVVELGIDDHKDELVLKKISTATKSALTRKYVIGCWHAVRRSDDMWQRYNGKEHPIPFYKAQDLGKAPKRLGGGPAPDIEDAFDVSAQCCDVGLYC